MIFICAKRHEREETREQRDASADGSGHVCGRHDDGAQRHWRAEPARGAEVGAEAAEATCAGVPVCDVAAGGGAACGGVDGVVAG